MYFLGSSGELTETANERDIGRETSEEGGINCSSRLT